MSQLPHLIFFVGESHSRALVGAHGHPQIQTPFIDQLAERGTLFRNAYCASPICVPARASIATGLFPHQHGYWENSIALDGKTITWMKELRNAGHHVAGIGKFHFRNGEDDNGFSEEILPMHLAEGEGELLGLLRSQGAEPIRTGLWDLYTKRCGAGDETSYQAYDRQVTKKAIEWLRAHAKDEKPWVLCVHYVSAHAPYTVPRALLDLYPTADIRLPPTFRMAQRPQHPAVNHLRRILGHAQDLDEGLARLLTASYYAAITYLDRQVGHVLDATDALELRDRTRVIYTADHGFSSGNHFIFGLFNLYEHSAGVPLIVAGPGVQQRSQVRQLASHVDLFPSLLDFFDMPCPRSMPGTSLVPALQGREDLHRPAFAEYHAVGSQAGSFMLRQNDMKLIHHVGMPSQLFDVAADPEEAHDLSSDPAAAPVLAALEKQLQAIVSPHEVDAAAKAAQQARIALLGGAEEIMRRRAGFTYSPPPGLSWRGM